MFKYITFTATLLFLLFSNSNTAYAQLFKGLTDGLKKLEKEVDKVGDILNSDESSQTETSLNTQEQNNELQTRIRKSGTDLDYSTTFHIETGAPYSLKFEFQRHNKRLYSSNFRSMRSGFGLKEGTALLYARLKDREYFLGELNCRNKDPKSFCSNRINPLDNPDGKFTELYAQLDKTFQDGGLIEFKVIDKSKEYTAISNGWVKIDIPRGSGELDTIKDHTKVENIVIDYNSMKAERTMGSIDGRKFKFSLINPWGFQFDFVKTNGEPTIKRGSRQRKLPEKYGYFVDYPLSYFPKRAASLPIGEPQGFYVKIKDRIFYMGPTNCVNRATCRATPNAFDDDNDNYSQLSEMLDEAFEKGGFIEVKVGEQFNEWFRFNIPANLVQLDTTANGSEPVASTSPSFQSSTVTSPYADDPVYRQCNSNNTLKTFYDCTCLVENSDQFEAQLVAQSKQGIKEERVRILERIADNEKTLSTHSDKTTFTAKVIIGRIEKDKELIAEIENSDQTVEIRSNDILKTMSEAGICKNQQGVFDREKASCMKTINRNGKDESYCTCTGNQAAKLWLESKSSRINSSMLVSLGTQARQACN